MKLHIHKNFNLHLDKINIKYRTILNNKKSHYILKREYYFNTCLL